jgi:hypothetical protein
MSLIQPPPPPEYQQHAPGGGSLQFGNLLFINFLIVPNLEDRAPFWVSVITVTSYIYIYTHTHTYSLCPVSALGHGDFTKSVDALTQSLFVLWFLVFVIGLQ